MSGERFVTGIEILMGSKKIRYRDAIEIQSDNHKLTFVTRVICTGNNLTEDLTRVQTRFNPETVSGIEDIVHNPIQMMFEKAGVNDTKVTVYLSTVEGFRIIAGY